MMFLKKEGPLWWIKVPTNTLQKRGGTRPPAPLHRRPWAGWG